MAVLIATASAKLKNNAEFQNLLTAFRDCRENALDMKKTSRDTARDTIVQLTGEMRELKVKIKEIASQSKQSRKEKQCGDQKAALDAAKEAGDRDGKKAARQALNECRATSRSEKQEARAEAKQEIAQLRDQQREIHDRAVEVRQELKEKLKGPFCQDELEAVKTMRDSIRADKNEGSDAENEETVADEDAKDDEVEGVIAGEEREDISSEE